MSQQKEGGGAFEATRGFICIFSRLVSPPQPPNPTFPFCLVNMVVPVVLVVDHSVFPEGWRGVYRGPIVVHRGGSPQLLVPQQANPRRASFLQLRPGSVWRPLRQSVRDAGWEQPALDED